MSAPSDDDRGAVIERSGAAATHTLADLEVGQTFSISRCFSSEDIDAFAWLSGDFSPLHVDHGYASSTEFGGRVVHGMLLASLFSTLVGMKVPGKRALYLGQDLSFRRPVLIDEPIVATAKITGISREMGLVQLAMSITKADGTTAVTGAGKAKVRESAADTPALPRQEAVADRGAGRPVALVTGAARGIGAAIARRLARDGFDVVVNYRSSEHEAARLVAELTASGVRAQAIGADLREAESTGRMVDQIEDTFGGLDLLVNNAAAPYDSKPAMDVEWGEVADQLDASLRAPLLLCQRCFEMLKARKGAVVNIISQVVEGAPPPRMIDYVVGKYGLLGLTRALASEWAGEGIRVNGVAPSLIQTDMTAHFKDRVFKLEASRTPLRRIATPDDVAAAVGYLGGRDAAFVTGIVLPVTGGQVMS